VETHVLGLWACVELELEDDDLLTVVGEFGEKPTSSGGVGKFYGCNFPVPHNPDRKHERRGEMGACHGHSH